MKKFLLLFFVFSFFTFLLFLPARAFAETINVSPQQANKGDIITITASDIPNSTKEKVYTVQIVDNRVGGNGLVRTTFIFVIRNGCQIGSISDTNMWEGISCSSTSQANSYTITGRLKSNVLIPQGAGDQRESSLLAIILRPEDTSPRQEGVKAFTIITLQSIATFTIDDISPNPAKPGATATITLGNIPKAGSYAAFVEGIANSRSTGNCTPPGPCTILLKLPDQLSSRSVTLKISVSDPDGNLTSKDITMELPEGTGNTIPTSTPTPQTAGPATSSSTSSSTDQKIDMYKFNPPDYLDKYAQKDTIINNALSLFLSILSIISIGSLIWGGIELITSEGDKQKVQGARGRITYAILGLILAFLSFFIVQLIGYVFGLQESGRAILNITL